MNEKTRSWIAGVVFCATLAGSVPAWAQQRAATDEDKRAPVMLRPNEKTAMLGDMREYLKGLQTIFTALAKEDMDAVAAQAKALGRINVFETYLMFPTVSGVRFRELAAQVHEDFEEIAVDALANRNPKTTLGKLATTMRRCVSCHESFRLSEMVHSNK